MLRKGPGRPRKVVHELISKQRPLKDTFNKLRKAPKAVRNAQANSAYPTGHLAAIQNTPASNGKKAKHGDAQQTFLVNQLALQYGKLGVRTKNELRNSGAFRVQVVDRGLCGKLSVAFPRGFLSSVHFISLRDFNILYFKMMSFNNLSNPYAATEAATSSTSILGQAFGPP